MGQEASRPNNALVHRGALARHDIATDNSTYCTQLSDCTKLYNTSATNVCNNIMCDPNLGQCMCLDNTAQSPQTSTQLNTSGYSCSHDEDCMHLDEDKSTWSNLVYACPNAKCNEGTCQCGSSCVLDSYSGICCQGIDIIGSDSFCIMSTESPQTSTYVPLYTSSVPRHHHHHTQEPTITSGPVTGQQWTQGPVTGQQWTQGPVQQQWTQGPVQQQWTQGPVQWTSGPTTTTTTGPQFTTIPLPFQQTFIPLTGPNSMTQGPQ